MSMLYVLLLLISAVAFILFLLLRLVWRDLKEARDEVEAMSLEVIRKNTELEAIRDVQDKIRKTGEKSSPKKTDAADPGDSISRIARLNGLQDSGKE